MRRAWAILLVTLFSISLIDVSLFADVEAAQAACCRRAGSHHCAMMAKAPSTGATEVTRERCPMYPKAGAVSSFANSILLDAAPAFFASIVAHPSFQPQNEARRLISLDRSSQKRGPPSILS